MDKKIARLLTLIFILAFFIDLSLIEFFLKPYEVVGENIDEKERIEKQISLGIDLEKFAQLSISGKDLQRIEEYCAMHSLDFSEYLATFMMRHHFEVDGIGEDLHLEYDRSLQSETLTNLYRMIFQDVEYFPVAMLTSDNHERYYYSNSFLAARTYGGERLHMGTDIMDGENEKGYFPIVSMTDGTVENIGWLELGGYRVGITTLEGSYFYYAHMDSYAKGLKEGNQVVAGQILGYMGSSGYGPEGTNDQFPVHLHIGISIPIGKEDEFWVNPYPILQMIEDHKIELNDSSRFE